jgi:hypothetical protein
MNTTVAVLILFGLQQHTVIPMASLQQCEVALARINKARIGEKHGVCIEGGAYVTR